MLQHSEVKSFGMLGAPLKFGRLFISFLKKNILPATWKALTASFKAKIKKIYNSQINCRNSYSVPNKNDRKYDKYRIISKE